MQSKPPFHLGQSWAGTVTEFMNTDTKESLDSLCQVAEYREYFQSKGWLGPEAITYEINRDGFRCADLDPAAHSLVALGCSYTMGIGLPLHSVWPSLVGSALELTAYNLGWGGSSADTCFRLTEYWIPYLKPRLVVMLAPPANRFELCMASGSIPVETFVPNSQAESAAFMTPFLKHYYSNDHNSEINRRKNQLAIQAVCAANGVPCQIYNCDDFMNGSREQLEYARDRLHAGPLGHQLLCARILKDHAAAQ